MKLEVGEGTDVPKRGLGESNGPARARGTSQRNKIDENLNMTRELPTVDESVRDVANSVQRSIMRRVRGRSKSRRRSELC